MISNFLHKFMGIALSFLIVVSGMSFTINKHLCTKEISILSNESSRSCCANEKKVNVAFDIEKSCCDLSETNNNIEDNDHCNDTPQCQSDCCLNVSSHLKVLDTEKVLSEKIIIKKFPVEKYFHSFTFSHFYAEIKNEVFTSFYPPPNLKLNFNILYQVFRI